VSRVVAFNKPFRVLTQFRPAGDKATLADFFDDPALRAVGRLDYDSEGLLLLTDDGGFVQRMTHPRSKVPKTYWAQVEGIPDEATLDVLRHGVTLKDGPSRPARVRRIEAPNGLWPRDPPIRYRASIPDSWLELTITEGRNRQVRRMTAAVGHPTLRLVRIRVGDWSLGGLEPGAWRQDRP
jgi:23S rRNA pseudouridine2457 synthase